MPTQPAQPTTPPQVLYRPVYSDSYQVLEEIVGPRPARSTDVEPHITTILAHGDHEQPRILAGSGLIFDRRRDPVWQVVGLRVGRVWEGENPTGVFAAIGTDGEVGGAVDVPSCDEEHGLASNTG
jgi:hypothetical protein